MALSQSVSRSTAAQSPYAPNRPLNGWPCRRATLGDAQILGDLQAAGWRRRKAFEPQPDVPNLYSIGLGDAAGHFAFRLAENDIVVVAEHNRMVVGFATVIPNRSRRGVFKGAFFPFEVGSIYVAEAYERQGIGLTVLAAALAEAARSGPVYAGIAHKHLPACALMRKAGGVLHKRRTVRRVSAESRHHVHQHIYTWPQL